MYIYMYIYMYRERDRERLDKLNEGSSLYGFVF